MKKRRILCGVTGIGYGHTYRQLPIIEHFADTSQVMIFAYDKSYEFYKVHFRNKRSVDVVRVAVPFYVGNENGLDFNATLNMSANRGQNFFITNCTALDKAAKKIGKPDLVITDYEPISAQYAYAYNSPLVTIDQQSKYLCGDFPHILNGYTYKDEIMRLHMFFPHAEERIATSFFKVPRRKGADKVQLFPSIIKNSVVKMKRESSYKKDSILVYISSAREFVQKPENVIRICSKQKDIQFHIFVSKLDSQNLLKLSLPNISIYKHGDNNFNRILGECSGIISTAGHSLLSEAMHLEIPVYAIPVSPYEQYMNASVINKYSFGISHPRLSTRKLSYFIKNISKFRDAIKKDTKVLLRGMGQEKIIAYLEKRFL